MPLFDSTGRPRTLASTPFAEGGEGKVHDVVGEPSIVAKVCKKSLAAEQATKLAAMVRLATPELLKVTAWPTETLHSRPKGSVTGILMPRLAAEFRDIFHLYNPDQRKQDFPDADWGFLIHAARNCAVAFEAIHAAGHVIGDVNQKNILVSPRGIVHLVDCDSFQIRDSTGKIYRCEVGVPDFTPPELQGQAFQNVDRTANHDRFGLAILIFQLLMIGRHPYAGVYAGPGEMPMQKAILTGRFAYSRSPNVTWMTPPPHAPSIGLLDPRLIDLFEQAFTKHGSIRPSPRQWYESLNAFSNQLKKCDTDSKHLFPHSRNICPWCELIKRTGGHVFSQSLKSKTTNSASFVLADVWAQIEAIRIYRFSCMRPPTTLSVNQPGKPTPLSLSDKVAKPLPLPSNLGLHAPRPTKPKVTLKTIGILNFRKNLLFNCLTSVSLIFIALVFVLLIFSKVKFLHSILGFFAPAIIIVFLLLFILILVLLLLWETDDRRRHWQSKQETKLLKGWADCVESWGYDQTLWEKQIRNQWRGEHQKWLDREEGLKVELRDRRVVRDAYAITLSKSEEACQTAEYAIFKGFTGCQSLLNQIKANLNLAARDYEIERRKMDSNNWQQQRDDFPKLFPVPDHIHGIPSHRIAFLRLLGIETLHDAFEVEKLNRMERIYTYGGELIQRLIVWRDEKISQFRYNPNLPSLELIALEQRYRSQVGPWEAELAAGPGRLRELVDRLQAHQATALQQIQAVVDQLHQAELDVAVVERLMG